MESDHDAILEACCYLGRGTMPHFDQIHRQAIEDPGFDSAQNVLANLHSLGHLEIFEDGPNGPLIWRVDAPSFMITGPSSAYMQGRRSNQMVDKVRTLVEDQGGALTKTPQEHGPSVISVEGVPSEALSRIGAEIAEDGRPPVYVAPQLSSKWASPSKQQLIESLPKTASPNTAKFFDISTLGWKDNITMADPGLYSIDSRPKQYKLRLKDKTWLSISYALGKHVVASNNKTWLMSYDRQSQVLSCLLGAPLPAPYNVIATKCTGFLPTVNRQSRTLDYAGVSPYVAAKIWRSLYD